MNECSSNLEFTMSMMIGLREDEAGTHDDTATKVLRKIEHCLRHKMGQPPTAPCDHREEGTKHGADQDDEDRRNADTETGRVAAAGAAVDVVVVVPGEEGGHVLSAGEDHGGGRWEGV